MILPGTAASIQRSGSAIEQVPGKERVSERPCTLPNGREYKDTRNDKSKVLFSVPY